MTISKRIKELRESKGLIQKELARKIAVSVQAVSAWETGLRNPNANQRKKLCEFFNITEAEFFGAAPKNSPDIQAALQDPIAVKALLITYKNSQDIKNTIKALLDCLPSLTPEKRQAILALCK